MYEPLKPWSDQPFADGRAFRSVQQKDAVMYDSGVSASLSDSVLNLTRNSISSSS